MITIYSADLPENLYSFPSGDIKYQSFAFMLVMNLPALGLLKRKELYTMLTAKSYLLLWSFCLRTPAPIDSD